MKSTIKLLLLISTIQLALNVVNCSQDDGNDRSNRRYHRLSSKRYHVNSDFYVVDDNQKPIVADRHVNKRSHSPSRHVRDIMLPSIMRIVQSKPTISPLPVQCPTRFDAATVAANGLSYLFSRDRVFIVWRVRNRQMTTNALITDVFPGGPRTVNSVVTNSRTGITILTTYRQVYRYHFNRRKGAFIHSTKSPKTLNATIAFIPRVALQWADGNQLLINANEFVTYDSYWNQPTFIGVTADYFPHFPTDLIGVLFDAGTHMLLVSADARISIYDIRSYRIVQEYPIDVEKLINCNP